MLTSITAVLYRYIRRELYHSRLGRCDLRTNQGEEGVRTGYSKYDRQRLVYLDTRKLFLSTHCHFKTFLLANTAAQQYLWMDEDAPRYTIALSSSAAFSVACAGAAWVMRFWLKRTNKKIRQNPDESINTFAY